MWVETGTMLCMGEGNKGERGEEGGKEKVKDGGIDRERERERKRDREGEGWREKLI